MILSGIKIREEVKKGNVSIYPFTKKLLNPNSYNYRLGNIIYEITDEIIDSKVKTNYKKIILKEEGYVLQPHHLYLAMTKEKIGSKKYVTQLIGRSSMGRIGLFLQVTAPLGHVGCYYNWTLELKAVQPLKIYKNMKIGQVTFWKITGKKYINYTTGKYNKHNKPYVSMFYKED